MAGIKIVGKLNTTNDTYIGAGSPTGIQAGGTVGMGGLLGEPVTLNSADALKLSDTTIGTLYAGKYVLVKLKAGVTNAAIGQVAIFDNATLTTAGFQAYQVTTAIAAATMGLGCGIFLNTVTAGNYCWIQVAGFATVLCAASVTDTTSGNIGVVTATPAITVDGIADAGAIATGSTQKRTLGVFLEAPANGALKKFLLYDRGFFPFLGQVY